MNDQRKPSASGLSPVELEGVRDERRSADPRAATRARELASQGLVAYSWAIDSQAMQAGAGERRLGNRREVRLRSGKLLDLRRQFICECLVRDRSLTGLRLTLSQGCHVPKEIFFYDDEAHGVMRLTVVWRRRSLLGVRIIRGPADPIIESRVRATMRGKFYAIQN